MAYEFESRYSYHKFNNSRENMSYNKYLETNQEAKREHDKSMKANAAERLKKNAAWNKANKAKK